MLTLEQLKNDKKLLSDFLDFFFHYEPYYYQIDFFDKCLNYNRIAGKWCRQSGKSFTVSNYALLRAIIKQTTIIIVAPTQNQSDELFRKIKNIVDDNPDLKVLVKRETQKELTFLNNSRIISLPSGFEGRTIRGYTADVLIIEEAGNMEDNIVNTVLIPMLASKKSEGQIIKIGTPLIRNHFYRSCFEDTNYQTVNVVWQDCVKVGQYSQSFIEEQKTELTDIGFRTEYEAEFIDAGMMFFPLDIIKNASETYIMLPQL